MSKSKAKYGAEAFIGQVLKGNYRLDKQVGAGGMAWVFSATHTTLEEVMAVKILLPHIAQDEEVRTRFINEAKIQFKLKHNNIVSVTDVIEEDGLIGIVMEWVNGENLKQFLKRVGLPLPLRDIWLLMAPVLDAVGYAHKRSLVHRDLKPPNIMLHNDREQKQVIPKVTDFGIAKLLDDDSHTQTGMVMGTVKYMSPEQMKDSKDVDHRSDIYSLGVMIYLMATGRLPYTGKNDMVIYKPFHEIPPRPSTLNPRLPPAFDAMMEKCLAKNPAQRYPTCSDLSHALSLTLLSTSGQQASDKMSPLEVQQRLLELPVTEPSHIYPKGSSIYESSIRRQVARSIEEMASEQSGSHSSGFKQINNSSIDNSKLPTGVPLKQGLDGAKEAITPKPLAQDLEAPLDIFEVEEEPKKKSSPKQSSPEDEPPKKKGGLFAVVGLVGVIALAGLGFAFYPKQPTSPKDAGTRTKVPPPRPPVATACNDGDQRPCYTAAVGCKKVNGVFSCKGPCKAGVRVCVGGKFGACKGEVKPGQESCNGKDDNCDGKVDETFEKAGKACDTKLGDCIYKGAWKCTPKGARCVRSGGFKNPNAPRVFLKVSPKRAKVRVSFKKRNRRFSGEYCIENHKSIWIKFRSRKYHACALRLKARSKPYSIRLKREKNGLLSIAPPASYCLRK